MNDLTYEELHERYMEALRDLEYAEYQIRLLRQSEENWMDFANHLLDRLSNAGLL